MASSGFRFVHTADWQIGRQYQRFEPEDAAALFEARFAVVQRIADYATQHDCDAVLVAGDVFDAPKRLASAPYGDCSMPCRFGGLGADSWQPRCGLWRKVSDACPAVRGGAVQRASGAAAQPVLLHDLAWLFCRHPYSTPHPPRPTPGLIMPKRPTVICGLGLRMAVSGICQTMSTRQTLCSRPCRACPPDHLALGIMACAPSTHAPGTAAHPKPIASVITSRGICWMSAFRPGATPQVRAVRVGQYVDAPQFQISMPTDAEQVVDYLQTLGPEHVVSLVLSGHLIWPRSAVCLMPSPPLRPGCEHWTSRWTPWRCNPPMTTSPPCRPTATLDVTYLAGHARIGQPSSRTTPTPPLMHSIPLTGNSPPADSMPLQWFSPTPPM